MPCIAASAVASRRRLQGRLLLWAVAKGNYFIPQKTRGDNQKGALYCGKCGRKQAAPSRPPPALRGCNRSPKDKRRPWKAPLVLKKKPRIPARPFAIWYKGISCKDFSCGFRSTSELLIHFHHSHRLIDLRTRYPYDISTRRIGAHIQIMIIRAFYYR